MANVFVEAKKIQKAHPRMKWQDAVKAAGKKISGVSKKAAKKPVKKTVSKTVIKSKTIGKPTNRSIGAVVVNSYSRAMAITKEIERLEAQRAKAKTQDAKNVIQHFINKQHDALDSIIK